MQFCHSLTFSLLALSAVAEGISHGRRWLPTHWKRQGTGCLSDEEAQQVGSVWTNLLAAYTPELANAALTEDFIDYSASALALNAQCRQAPGTAPPIGEPVFRSREEFKAGQGQAPRIESEILQVWHDCRAVTMRWKMTSLGTRPVFGNIVFDTVAAPQGSEFPFMIQTMYSEFDSASWVVNAKESGNCRDTSR